MDVNEMPSWYRPPVVEQPPARETFGVFLRRFMVRRAKRIASFAAGYAVVMAIHTQGGTVLPVQLGG